MIVRLIAPDIKKNYCTHFLYKNRNEKGEKSEIHEKVGAELQVLIGDSFLRSSFANSKITRIIKNNSVLVSETLREK